MDELQGDGDGFDLKCKVLMGASLLAFAGGLALTVAAVYQPWHYVLYTLGVVGAITAWALCLRDTTLVGPDDRAEPDPRADDPSGPSDAQDD